MQGLFEVEINDGRKRHRCRRSLELNNKYLDDVVSLMSMTETQILTVYNKSKALSISSLTLSPTTPCQPL